MIRGVVLALGLGGCSMFQGSPMERQMEAARELVAATNDGQVAQCEAIAQQATLMGQILPPSIVVQSPEMQSLQKLLQRFLGGG